MIYFVTDFIIHENQFFLIVLHLKGGRGKKRKKLKKYIDDKYRHMNMYWLILLGIIIAIVIIGFAPTTLYQQGGALDYSAYFAPWWRQYYGSTPLYGTSSTSVDQYLVDPGSYYNWASYWRRPATYDYWRKPYYYERKVFRPYVQDSIPGRRLRKEYYKFDNDTDVQNGVQALPQGQQGEPIDEAIQDARIEAAYSDINAQGNYYNTSSNTPNVSSGDDSVSDQKSAQVALQKSGSYKYGIFYE